MKNLSFTTTHEWLDHGTTNMSVGITKHAQSLLGDMVYVDLPAVGTEFKAGDEIGVLESVKAASEIYAPISGVITEINSQVIETPSLINSDPFGAGWLVKIQAHNLEEALAEIAELLKEQDYLDDVVGEQ